MSKIKTKENIEDTTQLTPTQIAKAVSEAKKIAADRAKESTNLIDWTEHVAAFQNNPPQSIEEAVSRVVTASADSELSNDDRHMLEQMMLSNPAIVEVLQSFLKK